SGGVQGYNLSQVWSVEPLWTTTSNSITLQAGMSIKDATNFSRGTNGFIWIEVEVDNSATVNLPPNSFSFSDGTDTLTNIVGDSASVSIDFTENPDADTTECQPLDIGILLDDTGSLTVEEREEIAEGLEGMIDNLIAIHEYTD